MGSQGSKFSFWHGDFTGKEDNVDPQWEEEFKNAVIQNGIPEENILNFIHNGNRIILFSLAMPFTLCVNIRKQISLIKISSSTSNLFQDPLLKKRKKP